MIGWVGEGECLGSPLEKACCSGLAEAKGYHSLACSPPPVRPRSVSGNTLKRKVRGQIAEAPPPLTPFSSSAGRVSKGFVAAGRNRVRQACLRALLPPLPIIRPRGKARVHISCHMEQPKSVVRFVPTA